MTGNASDIVISSKDTNHIYIVVNTKIWRSTNGGQTFVDYSNQLPATTQYKLFLDDYSNNETVYVGIRWVFISTIPCSRRGVTMETDFL
ncbi:MAG: hypothetical protein HWD58_03845 [Bacteroidota bacterium]|nr:MAG: hypothetical protein HWD58_03845 [Bacteroidota bacterium]